MRRYKNIIIEKKEVEKIVCNRCGREIPVVQGVPAEDYLEVSKRWSYPSDKDNRIDEFEICEKCYDEIISQFRYPVSDLR